MIEYKKGNLLDVTEGIIIHGCNAQGVMGSGVALAVKEKYPTAYKDYVAEYEYRSKLDIGNTVKSWVSEDLMIINAITQDKYGRDNKRYVNYAAIVRCFDEAISYARAYQYDLHFPKIGAGLGGGDWNIIEQLINDCDPEDKVKKICWEL